MPDDVYVVSTENGGLVIFSSEEGARSYAEMHEKCYDESVVIDKMDVKKFNDAKAISFYSIRMNFLSGLICSGKRLQFVTDDVVRMKDAYYQESNEQMFYSRISLEDAEQFAKEERDKWLQEQDPIEFRNIYHFRLRDLDDKARTVYDEGEKRLQHGSQ